MQCKRCDGLGTVTLNPRRDDGNLQPNGSIGDEAGQVIALCPVCHGSGSQTSLRMSVRRPTRRPLRWPPRVA